LYMTFCYKTKWFLKKQENKKIEESIESFLKSNKKKFFNGLFDLSQFGERDTIYHLLHSLGFDIVETNEHQKCVDIRNNCAHANGKIRYSKKKIDIQIEEEAEFVEKIQKKIIPELEKILSSYIKDNWAPPIQTGYIRSWIITNYFSEKDLEIISTISLPLFNKKSDNEKIIYQKILYLLLIFEIQKQIGSDENLFLQKLPILMVDLNKFKKFKENGDEDKKYTSKIIEEFIMPIISNFSDEDRKKAEKILKLS